MTAEITSIRDEIQDFRVADMDIAFFEALANNVVYCLNKHQKDQQEAIPRQEKKLADNVITDILETLSKEVVWAKEELDNENKRIAFDYLKKAKYQIVDSMAQLFNQ